MHNNTRKPLAVLVTIWLALFGSDLLADLASEQRLTRELLDREDLVGEAVMLGEAGTPPVALAIDGRLPERRGGAILLHDSHANADATDVIHPLRTGLADAGWDTLSVQLPVAYPGSGLPDAAAVTERLALAQRWLADRDMEDIVVIAQGDSVGPAIARLAADASPTVRALVLVSSPTADDYGDGFRRLRVPLLDVVAEFDTPSVSAARITRTAWARESGQTYRALAIPAATPGFRATTGLLVARVRAWLAGTVDEP